jgi:hypothetical protein
MEKFGSRNEVTLQKSWRKCSFVLIIKWIHSGTISSPALHNSVYFIHFQQNIYLHVWPYYIVFDHMWQRNINFRIVLTCLQIYNLLFSALFVVNLRIPVYHIILYQILGWLVSNELEGMCKEAVMTKFNIPVLSRYLSGRTEENHGEPRGR